MRHQEAPNILFLSVPFYTLVNTEEVKWFKQQNNKTFLESVAETC